MMNFSVSGTSALSPNSISTLGLEEVYQWALNQGLSPIPCHSDFVSSRGKKGKAPSISATKSFSWAQYQTKQPSLEQCKVWAESVPGLGAIVSDEYVVIDIDFNQLENAPEKRSQAIADMVETLENRCPKLSKTYIQRSGSGGYHIFVKVLDGQKLGTSGTGTYNLMWNGSKVGEVKKGFVVLAPSRHESGKRYEAVNGLCDIVTLTLSEFETLGLSFSETKKQLTYANDNDRCSHNVVDENLTVVLEHCLSLSAYETIAELKNRVSSSEDLWAVACEVYGWAKWLDEQGIPYIGSPETLIERTGAILGYSDADIRRKSEKAEERGSPAADEKGRWLKIRSLNRTAYDHKCPIRLKQEIEQTNVVPIYSTKHSPILEELKEFDPDEFKKQLNDLANAKQCWDEVKGAFPCDVVSAIEVQSSESGIPSEVYAMVWLTAITADLNGKYKVLVHPKTEWYEPLNLWTVINGESGIGKTIPVKQVTGYLHELNETYRDQHKADMEEYESELTAWERNRKDGGGETEEPKPEEPKVRYAAFSKGTLEKLIQVMDSQKNQHQTGLLIAVDEIATLLNSFNKYNSGADDAAQFLQAWSGSEVSTDTKTGGWVGVNDARLSILGTVQPDVWEKLMKKYSANGSGFEQRWLIVEIDRDKLKKINHADETVPDYSISAVTITWIDRFKDLSNDSLTPGCGVITCDRATINLKNQIENWWKDDTAERAKMKSYIYRIAGVLAALAFHDPDKVRERKLISGLSTATAPVITSKELLAACRLVKYCMACKESLMKTAVSSTADGLVAKAIAIYEKNGKLTNKLLSLSSSTFKSLKAIEKTEIIRKVYETVGGKLTKNKQGGLTLIK